MAELDERTRREIGEQISGSDLEPAAVAQLVAETPEETMRELLTGEIRAAATEQIIRRFPDYVDAGRTAEVEAAVGWEIADGGDVERFLLVFDRGRVSAGRELDFEPRVTLSLDAVDFLRLATGNADPATLFLSGRLGALRRRAVRDRDGLVSADPRRRRRDRGRAGARPERGRRDADRRRGTRRARRRPAAGDAGPDPRADPR